MNLSRAVFGLLCCSVSCATSPETHRQQLIFIPDSQMNQLGVDAYTEILSKSTPANSPTLAARVETIGRRIAAASGKSFDWQFTLLDEGKTVNAFCLPGGKVAVYTGILPVAKTDAGLAAVLGHEVAHAVLRHGAERMSQGVMAQAGLSLAQLSFNDSKYRNLITSALGLGVQFGVMLPYSRKHESEADTVGLEYMAKAGYEPREAVTLWQRMAAQGGKVPELLSTHPDPRRRATELQAQLPNVAAFFEASQKQPSAELL